jgi:glycosyltransferase involved in cell wall biosynthesis
MTGLTQNSPPVRYSVVLICSSYPPVLGGTEIEAQRVCSALAKNGHCIQVFSIGGPPMPAEANSIDPSGVRLRLFGAWCPPRWRQYAYALSVGWTLFRDRRDYEILYFLMGGIQLAAALPVARMLRKRIVMKFSGSNTIAPLSLSLLGRLELKLLRSWAHRILVLNPAMVEEAVSAGLERGRLALMPNPVDIDQFSPVDLNRRAELRRARGLHLEAPVILFVGRLAPEKQLPSLVEAFAKVRGRRPEAHLVLVGDGPLRSDLEIMARDRGLQENIHFAGAIPSVDVSAWLQCADIFALVSSLEGFPCSLVEAMSVGLPAVVSDISANLQLVEDGVHGCVVPCQDQESIAQALVRLIDQPCLRSAYGRAARQRVVARYSTLQVRSHYEHLFQDLSGATATRSDLSLINRSRECRGRD